MTRQSRTGMTGVNIYYIFDMIADVLLYYGKKRQHKKRIYR